MTTNNALKTLYETATYNKAIVRQSFSGDTGLFTLGYFEGPHQVVYQNTNPYKAAYGILLQLEKHGLIKPVPEGYCQYCKKAPCDRLGVSPYPGDDEFDDD